MSEILEFTAIWAQKYHKHKVVFEFLTLKKMMIDCCILSNFWRENSNYRKECNFAHNGPL